MIAANDALERLKQGNARFAANVRDMSALASKSRRHDLLDGQEPFAIVLGCSDSRVPAELVFDQGLGDHRGRTRATVKRAIAQPCSDC